MLVSRNPKIFSKKIDGKWVILEKNKEYTQELNELASFVWEILTKPMSEVEIICAICQEYKIDEITAQKDTFAFIKSYLHQGFLISNTLPR